jgi:hypothetical protein
VRLRPGSFTFVDIASNNLIALGDPEGYVHIWDVSAGRFIARQKVCEHPVWPAKFIAEKGYLWAGSNRFAVNSPEKVKLPYTGSRALNPILKPKRR